MSTQQTKITPDEAQEILDYYEPRPELFVTDVLRSTPWPLQSEIIAAVFKYPTVAVKSCNASGKSYISARIALTFLTLKPGSIVITTAPTWRQVKDVLWREIRTAYSLSAFKLSEKECNQVGLDFADDWFAVGLSTKDSEKFFGYHADDILVIVDEASGVEEEVYIGVDAVTPNLNAHVLMIGNPTNPDGRFYKAFKDPLVKKFTISAFDTPNFTANGITSVAELIRVFTPPLGVEPLEHMISIQKMLELPYPALINPVNAYRRLLQWGEEHPMWEALILGEFPSQATNTLIPLNLIMKSVDVWKQINAAKKQKEYAKRPEWNIEVDSHHQYGLDVARFGDDMTVLFPRLGGYVEEPTSWGKLDTSVTTEKAIDAMSIDDWKAIIRVDDTGLGGGVTDQLRKAKQENENYLFSVVPINFGAGTTNPLKYFNLRAEMYWNLRKQFVNHAIAIPDHDELIAELASIRYDYAGKERNIIKIESKQEIKDRLKRSPDFADALVLAFAKQGSGTWADPLEGKQKPEEFTPITGGLQDRY